jgi:hypothetical protein
MTHSFVISVACIFDAEGTNRMPYTTHCRPLLYIVLVSLMDGPADVSDWMPASYETLVW